MRFPRPLLAFALVGLVGLVGCAMALPDPGPEQDEPPTEAPDPCDEGADSDGDGQVDGCDPCPDDPLDDSDGDTVCDSDDVCAGSNDLADSDGDAVPDGCDAEECDDGLDNDGDGLADADDEDCFEEPTPEPESNVCPGPDGAPDGVKLAEISECAGIARPIDQQGEYLGTAQAWGDVDRDGILDLVTADPETTVVLYLGQPDGTFVPAEGWLPQDYDLVGGANFVDFDDDGLRDLHLLRLGPDVLLRNIGSVFLDVTAVAGVGAHGMSQSSAWADFDGDGDLDVYVVAWICDTCSDPETGEPIERISDDFMYRNEGGGLFTDVSDWLPQLMRSGPGYSVLWTDLDDDGDPDLLVANDKGWPGEPPPGGPLNRMAHFRNDGPGCDGHCFTEIGVDSGFGLSMDGMGLDVADYDFDGDLDVLVSDNRPARLFEQMDGLLVDVSLVVDTGTEIEVGEEETWGACWLDLENDGCLDFYAPVGPSSGPPVDHLRLATCEETFIDGIARVDPVEPAICYGMAKADYDRDGLVDFVEGCDGVGHRLFRNLGEAGDGRWLQVRLTGGGGVNLDAVGSKVLVTGTDGREHLQEVRIGGSVGSGHDLTLHFGLGDAQVESLSITWPDGLVDEVGAVDSGQLFVRSRTDAGP
jgi:enediyne biosynthesis protein E4